MSPGDLENVFGALSVGLLAILSGATMHWIAGSERSDLYQWMNGRSWIPRSSQSVFFGVLIMFAIGVLAQDFTDHLTDSEYNSMFHVWVWPPHVQKSILGSEAELRFATLFKKNSPSSGGSAGNKETPPALDQEAWALTSLGREIFSNRQYLDNTLKFGSKNADIDEETFADAPTKYLGKPESHPKGRNDKSKCYDARFGLAKDFVCRLYYTAKNWAYNNANYYNELEAVQRRVDFTRSAFLIGSWTIFGNLFLLVLIGFEVILKRSLTPHLLFLSTPALEQITPGEKALRVVKSLVILTVISGVSWIGYRNAENNFNERAFGYYISYLSKEGAPAQPAASSPTLAAALWMKTSAEYRAVALQTYAAAYSAVERKAKAFHGDEAKPLAVVMDLDETVLDNGKYQSYLQLNNLKHTKDTWSAWVKEESGVGLVPGALPFIEGVRKLGVTVVFISNRPETLRKHTLKVLTELGIWTGKSGPRMGGTELFLEKESPGKDKRRQAAARKYHIVAELGDNMADFSDAFLYSKSGSVSERNTLLEKNRGKLGSEWFVLPNPAYGDWSRYLDMSAPETYLKTTY